MQSSRMSHPRYNFLYKYVPKEVALHIVSYNSMNNILFSQKQNLKCTFNVYFDSSFSGNENSGTDILDYILENKQKSMLLQSYLLTVYEQNYIYNYPFIIPEAQDRVSSSLFSTFSTDSHWLMYVKSVITRQDYYTMYRDYLLEVDGIEPYDTRNSLYNNFVSFWV